MKLNRIGVKLVLVMAAMLAVEAGVHYYFSTTWNAEAFRNDFLNGGRVHAASLAQAAEYGLLTRDARELERVANMLRLPDDADLLYVAFYDETGELLASRQWSAEPVHVSKSVTPGGTAFAVRPWLDPDRRFDECYEFCSPVQVSRAVMGAEGDGAKSGAAAETATVVAVRSYAAVKAHIEADQRRALLLSGGIFAVFAAVLILLAWRLVRPIRTLSQGTERVAAGDLETLVDVGRRRDEFRTLADSFNRMMGQLKDQRNEILSYSRELEDKVAERTAALAEANGQLEAANQHLQELATTDELTGLWNRRRFMEMLRQEIERTRRHKIDLALAMVDVDQFKAINDTYGHSYGDLVLREIGKMLQGGARTTDVVARYAGDEFMILMPSTSAEAAISAAERIRKQVADRHVSDGKHVTHVTVSVGIGALTPGRADTADSLVHMADEALYAAKHSGRDCVKTIGQIAEEIVAERSVKRAEVDRLRRRISRLSLRSRHTFIRGIRGLVHAMEARDPYAKSHSENVARFAVGIARQLHLDKREVGIIRRAALIHDIGKIGVPDGILWKPGVLSNEERLVMQHHVLIGIHMLEQMRFMDSEIPLVRHHHERFDGHGYPDNISGEAIPLGARILAVADTFDSITGQRVYRPARSAAEAMNILIEESGHQFDPRVVDAAVRWVQTTFRNDVKTEDISVPQYPEPGPADRN